MKTHTFANVIIQDLSSAAPLHDGFENSRNIISQIVDNWDKSPYITHRFLKTRDNMSAYLDIIFLLIVAVIIFARLRNVLGTRPEQNNEVRVVSHEEFEKIKSNFLFFEFIKYFY